MALACTVLSDLTSASAPAAWLTCGSLADHGTALPCWPGCSEAALG